MEETVILAICLFCLMFDAVRRFVFATGLFLFRVSCFTILCFLVILNILLSEYDADPEIITPVLLWKGIVDETQLNGTTY